jgi:hypothetical protein
MADPLKMSDKDLMELIAKTKRPGLAATVQGEMAAYQQTKASMVSAVKPAVMDNAVLTEVKKTNSLLNKLINVNQAGINNNREFAEKMFSALDYLSTTSGERQRDIAIAGRGTISKPEPTSTENKDKESGGIGSFLNTLFGPAAPGLLASFLPSILKTAGKVGLVTALASLVYSRLGDDLKKTLAEWGLDQDTVPVAASAATLLFSFIPTRYLIKGALIASLAGWVFGKLNDYMGGELEKVTGLDSAEFGLFAGFKSLISDLTSKLLGIVSKNAEKAITETTEKTAVKVAERVGERGAVTAGERAASSAAKRVGERGAVTAGERVAGEVAAASAGEAARMASKLKPNLSTKELEALAEAGIKIAKNGALYKEVEGKGTVFLSNAEKEAVLKGISGATLTAAEKGSLSALGIVLKGSSLALKAVPLAGDIYMGYENYQESGSFGQALAATGGSFIGRTGGALLGSFAGPVGTFTGEVGGSLAGAYAGAEAYKNISSWFSSSEAPAVNMGAGGQGQFKPTTRDNNLKFIEDRARKEGGSSAPIVINKGGDTVNNINNTTGGNSGGGSPSKDVNPWDMYTIGSPYTGTYF